MGKENNDNFTIPRKKEYEYTSIRVPSELLRAYDTLANETGHSRNEIITMALEFALSRLSVK